MEPRLFEGDRVFIDLRYTIPSPEGIFALWDGYGLVIKRLQIVMGSEPMRVRIISANASMRPMRPALDDVRSSAASRDGSPSIDAASPIKSRWTSSEQSQQSANRSSRQKWAINRKNPIFAH